jgi:hypothetical protein
VRRTLLFLLALSACRRTPDPMAELAAHIPTHSAIVAGLDVDRLRNTPLYPKLPDSFREASYVLAGYEPPNLVTASRVNDRVIATGPKVNAPPYILGHAAAAPLWVVARGDAQLPLTGNLANLTKLLRQTDYTRVTAHVSDRVEFAAEGVCSSESAAEHLEQNVRAIATLTKLPLDIRRDGLTVHVKGATTADALARLF